LLPAEQAGDAVVPSILTIVPAKDEELHITRCVASALPLGQVVVIDGGSRDATVELATRQGATVLSHQWQGYANRDSSTNISWSMAT
jgi:glycosyltransferase involved in cell wall biosynthesis